MMCLAPAREIAARLSNLGRVDTQKLFFQWCMRHFHQITMPLTRAASNLLHLPFSEVRGVHDILGMDVRVRADSFIL